MKAEAARPIKEEKHLWYIYNGKKPFLITDTKGAKLTLRKGDLYGVQNLTTRIDRLVVPERPDMRYMVRTEDSGVLIFDSKRHKEPVKFAALPPKPAKVKKVKIVLTKPDPEPEVVKTPKATRLETIRKLATPAPPKLVQRKVRRPDFDFDEDTFTDDEPFGF